MGGINRKNQEREIHFLKLWPIDVLHNFRKITIEQSYFRIFEKREGKEKSILILRNSDEEKGKIKLKLHKKKINLPNQRGGRGDSANLHRQRQAHS